MQSVSSRELKLLGRVASPYSSAPRPGSTASTASAASTASIASTARSTAHGLLTGPMSAPEEGLRLVFLDIDGVICCNRVGELEASKLAQLQRICRETGAKVVLSTDWRRQAALKRHLASLKSDLMIAT